MINKNPPQIATNEPDYQKLLLSISLARSAPYRSFFRCTSDKETVGAYFWGQAIAAAFQPTLGMYEVALRNAIHREASRMSSKGTSDSYPWYDNHLKEALPTRGKTRDKVEDVLCDKFNVRLAIQPSPDQVVASLSFGFWTSFLTGLTQRQQPVLLTRVFAAHPHSKPAHWSYSANVEQLMTKLKGIQDLRNAVAHYEPIWKPHRLTGTEPNWTHCISSLRDKHSDMLTVMTWCCPDSAHAVANSYATRVLRSICSTNAVRAFLADPFGAGSMALFEPPPQVMGLAPAA